MNKKIIIIVSLLLLVIIVIGVKIFKDDSALELTYETNGGVPFKWEYQIEDESIVEYVKLYVVKDENKNGKVGAPIYTNYVFKGLKKGTTTITFRYVNIIDFAAIPKFRKK